MAAVAAAGIISTSAQVFSVNVVGFVNTVIRGNGQFTLVSNPLQNSTNTLDVLFADAPQGTTVYKFVSGAYVNAVKIPGLGIFSATVTVVPGEAVFVLSPAGSANFTNVFVGEVQQGLLTNSLPVGFSLVSSRVPQAGSISQLGYTNAVAGDQIYKVNGTAYDSFSYVPALSSWTGAAGLVEPQIAVGEGFWFNKATAGNWVRNFVSQ